jgi:CDP-diacylglycerol--glycerol-3-phosphate 3-phosphatidyltransferase
VLAAGTLLRIVLAPVIMGLLLADGATPDTAAAVAAVLFCIAAATDWIDGRLARRWGVTTKLGSFLDTTADKLLVAGCLVALVAVERASPWVALIIIGRELVIMGLRGVLAAEGSVMQPSLLGKLKTSVQFLAIALAIVRPGDPVAGLYVDEWVMLAAAAVTLVSAVDYLARSSSALTVPSARQQ